MLFEVVRDHWVIVLLAAFGLGILLGIHEAATSNPADDGWEELPLQKPGERLLRSIDGRGRTSVQIRQQGGRVKKEVR